MARFFEYTPAQRKVMAARNAKGEAAVTVADQLDFGVINVMFLAPVLHQFLEEIGKYFLFPIAAGAHVFKTILAWRQAWLDRKQRSVVGALVETVATMAIIAAVVGSLVAGGLFALATPIMFTAALGGKTLYAAGSAVYYAGKASSQTDLTKKAKYRKLAMTNGMSAVAGAVATAAVVAVFLLGKIALAGIGVAAAVLGVAVAVIKGYRMHKAEQAAKAALVQTNEETRQESSLVISNTLGLENKGTTMKVGEERDVEDETSANDAAVVDVEKQRLLQSTEEDVKGTSFGVKK